MNGVIDDIEFTSLDTLLDSREMRTHSTTTNRSTVSFGTDARKRSLLDVRV